MLESFSEGEIK
jgi:hypothetical protein